MVRMFALCAVALFGIHAAYCQDAESRARKIVSQLTLEEKVLQMQNNAPAVPRLGITAYNWWSECLHGVARNGIATVFPQAIGMAATWDPELIKREADVISTEARAKHNKAMKKGKSGIYQGLTFWSPNINIFRDPRWGRGQETYGEDPYLTGRIGVAFVKGLQGSDPNYYKVISTAKHFAVHSGPESLRHQMDANCSDTDLYETYLPAFEALIREGKAGSVMGAYNRFRNDPCCASDLLLGQTLRNQWNFRGYVVSDCGAVWDIYHGHAMVKSAEQASVMCVKAGCDLTCGDEYESLVQAVKDGSIPESIIDTAVARLFTARMKLGMFDPDSVVPYAGISMKDNDTEESRRLALKVARESMVLLKNEDATLPLTNNIHTLAVIGPYANNIDVLLGNYNGTPSDPVTFLKGLREHSGRSLQILYAEGAYPLENYAQKKKPFSGDGSVPRLEKKALKIAAKSDAIVFIGGISPNLEGEEMRVKIPGFSGGDRTTLDLPANQLRLIKELKGTGKPVILVLTGGSALSISWADENLPAILEAWYPGEEGGRALADILFGDYNPAGRLPVTFYRSVTDLRPFEDYAMKGRTYRFFKGSPLYAFGYGLSYTRFDYLSVVPGSKSVKPEDTLTLNVALKNTGNFNGDEVIQVYVRKKDDGNTRPIRSLKAFMRVNLTKQEEKTISIPLVIREFRVYDPVSGDYVIRPGEYDIEVGAASDDIKLRTSVYVK